MHINEHKFGKYARLCESPSAAPWQVRNIKHKISKDAYNIQQTLAELVVTETVQYSKNQTHTEQYVSAVRYQIQRCELPLKPAQLTFFFFLL